MVKKSVCLAPKTDPTPRIFRHLRVAVVAILLLPLVMLLGCDQPAIRERPSGYFRIGPAQQFLQPETYLPEIGFLIRFDDRGFSAMSTFCTVDLTGLVRKETEVGVQWIATENESVYGDDGRVVSGPAVGPLPYYELQLEAGVYGGPRDTLFVKVGSVKSKNWRLAYSLATGELQAPAVHPQ